ncbi:MAG: hypothetical protein ABIO43_05685 [Sphingomicrobium sp.]
MTDRPLLLVDERFGLNVRRLMYQSLIWSAVLGDETSGMRAALNAENLQRPADALIDRVGRNSEFRGNFLGREVLVDKA